ncbi:MAG: hypothetical protein OEZ59_08170 [Deltaproteobacteria bacterium]|nr:hypothetical protein [Deltaproteobacteria bacterium]
MKTINDNGNRRGGAFMRPLLALLLTAGALLVAPSPPIMGQQAAGEKNVAESLKDFKVIPTLDVAELKRMIQMARESGFTEEQVREITIEDTDGTQVNAWKYIKNYELYMKLQQSRQEEERNKVYLTPQDVITELNGKQNGEIDSLRENLLLVD